MSKSFDSCCVVPMIVESGYIGRSSRRSFVFALSVRTSPGEV